MTESTELLIGSLREDRAALLSLAGGDLDLAVPTCPGWNLRELLIHLGRVHRWAGRATESAPTADWPDFPPRPGPGTHLGSWIVDGIDSLIERFCTTDLDRPCWGFAGDADLRWWLRRQTLETVLHRWDGQNAGGSPDPIDGDLAVVGVDEWCELESARWFKPQPGLSATVHLHATDGDGEWLLRISPEGFTWQHGHHKGDVAVRASRAKLFLILWNRRGIDSAEVFGDTGTLSNLLAATAV